MLACDLSRAGQKKHGGEDYIFEQFHGSCYLGSLSVHFIMLCAVTVVLRFSGASCASLCRGLASIIRRDVLMDMAIFAVRLSLVFATCSFLGSGSTLRSASLCVRLLCWTGQEERYCE